MKKRGISAVVATVLIILITVAAVTILWASIIPMIRDSLEFSALSGRVSIVTSGGYTFYDATNKKMSVQVKRDVDDGVMNRIRIVLSIDGNSFGSSVIAPTSGNTRVYIFPVKAKPNSISVAPIFIIGKKKKEGAITSTIKVSNSNSNSVFFPSENLRLVLSGSLINSDSWKIGSGSVTGYFSNGLASENVREMGIGPFGNDVLLWKAVPDSSDEASGGWNSDPIAIDSTKTYRSTVWIKKTGSIGGTTYFGIGDNTENLYGTTMINAYFWSADLPELNKWYLLVGYIHGSGYGSTISYGGIYDGVTGKKVISMTDYKNKPSSTVQLQRAYLFYDNTTTDRQYFWNPTFTDVSGYNLPLEI